MQHHNGPMRTAPPNFFPTENRTHSLSLSTHRTHGHAQTRKEKIPPPSETKRGHGHHQQRPSSPSKASLNSLSWERRKGRYGRRPRRRDTARQGKEGLLLQNNILQEEEEQLWPRKRPRRGHVDGGAAAGRVRAGLLEDIDAIVNIGVRKASY